VFWMSRLGLRI